MAKVDKFAEQHRRKLDEMFQEYLGWDKAPDPGEYMKAKENYQQIHRDRKAVERKSSSSSKNEELDLMKLLAEPEQPKTESKKEENDFSLLGLFEDSQNFMFNKVLDPLSDLVGRTAFNVADKMWFGQGKNSMIEDAPDFIKKWASPGETAAEKTANVVGSLGGYVAPGMAAVKGAKMLGAGAKITDGMSKTQKALQYGKEGAVAGGLFGLAEQGIDEGLNPENADFKERLKRVGIEAATGAVLDPAIVGAKYAADPYLQKFTSWLKNRQKPNDFEQVVGNAPKTESRPFNVMANNPVADFMPNQQQQPTNPIETLLLGDGKSRGVNYNPTQPQYDEILRLPDPGVPSRSLNGKGPDHWASRLDELFEVARKSELPPGYEREAVEDLWSRIAEPEDPSLDELIDLATPTLEEMRKYEGFDQGDPLQFKRTQVHGEYGTVPTDGGVKVNPKLSNPLDFSGRSQPMNATRVEGNYRTVPTDRGVRVESTPTSTPNQEVPPRRERTNTNAWAKMNGELEFVNPLEKPNTQSLDDLLNPKETYQKGSPMDDLLNQLGGTKHQETSRKGEPMGVSAFADNLDTGPIARDKTLMDLAKSGKVTAKAVWQKFKEQNISDLQVSKDVEEAIRGTKMHHSYNPVTGKKIEGKGIEADKSWYKGLRAARRANSKSHYAVENGLKPIMRGLEKAGIGKKDFEDYIFAKHARDIMESNKSLSPEEQYVLPSEATPKWVNDTLNRWEGTTAMENAQKQFVNYNKQMLKEQVNAGIMSQEAMNAMLAKHPNYVSLARDVEKMEQFFGSKNVTRSQQHVKRRKQGSEDQIVSPLDSAIKNTYLTIANAEKNKAMSRIEELANLDTNGDFFRKMEPHEKAEGKPVVSFFENGQKQMYEVDPAIYRMTQLLDEKQLHGALRAFSEANKLLRKGATQYNYKFILRSMLRDPQSALVTSRTGMMPWDLANAWLDSLAGKHLEKITNGKFKSYKDIYEKEGGLYSGLISMDNQSIAKAKREITQGKFTRGISYVNPAKWIGEIGQTAEHIPKLAEFRSAKRKGLSDSDAMYEAVDVIDYSDAGSVSRDLNKVITFYNAAIRGNVRLGQAFAENPARMTRNAIAAVSVPTVLALAARYHESVSDEQREKLDHLHDWEKNMFWHIPVSNSEDILAIPKAHVIGQAFANPIERTFEYLKSEDKKAYEGMMKDLVQSLRPPTGMAGVQSLVETVTNHNFFLDGAPIVSDDYASLPVEDQHNVRTSEVSKEIGERAKLSPMKVDHFLKGLTGGAGQQALGAIDSLVEDRPDKVATRDNPMNFLEDVFTRSETRGSGQTQEVWEGYGEVYNDKKNERDKLKNRIRQNDPYITNDQITDLLRKADYQYSEKGKYDLASDITDAFRQISQTINNVENHEQMSGQEKRAEVKRLRDMERRLNKIVREKGLLDKIKLP